MLLKNINILKLKRFDSSLSHYILAPLLTVITFLIFWKQPIKLLPDLFNLLANNNISIYLSTILSSISSLLGLLIVVLLIAFEYYKSHLKSLYLKYFIKNKYLIILVNYYIFSFVYSGLTLLVIKESNPTNGNELTIVYLSLFSFILLIPLTFYLSYKLVKSLSINSIIDEQLSNLSFDNIFLIDKNGIILEKAFDENDTRSITDIVEYDALNVLYKLIINQLLLDNIVKAQTILTEIIEKFVNYLLVGSEENIKDNCKLQQYRLANFLTTLAFETSVNYAMYNKIVLRKILSHVQFIYEKYNSKKYNIMWLEPFRSSFYEKIMDVYQDNSQYRIIILKHFKEIITDTINTNLPPQEFVMQYDSFYRQLAKVELSESNNYKDNYEYLQTWELFNEEFLKLYIDELKYLIEKRSEGLFVMTHELFVSIIFYWGWGLKKDKSYLRYRWLILNNYKIIMYYKIAIERKIIFKIDGNDVLPYFQLIELFKEDSFACRTILVEYFHFIVWLNRNNNLNYDIFCGVISMGDWGRIYTWSSVTCIGVYLMDNYHKNEMHTNCSQDLFAFFELILDDLKKGISAEVVNKENVATILFELKKAYNSTRNTQAKTQDVVDRINKIEKDFEIIFTS